MSEADLERLRKIRSFPSLVKYLRDDLDWPIESEDFDDLTFDYTPEELGIDAKTAAKIQDIKQLRKLTTSQQWGIFFVKFEPRRLPVVALRRILGRLVIKKRESANASERASWQKNDLLFISSFGEGEDRQLSFAHFTDNDTVGDLPTLKVLGWDKQDRDLKLEHVHGTLQAKLRWPDDDADTDSWRTQWASAFELRPREVIDTSKKLAAHLADLARNIRDRVNAALDVESDAGPLTTLMNAFRQSLIHDLEPDDFADMYAQTIAYGLLSARVSRPAELVADNLVDMVPITNPFLKELMETFLHVGGRRWSDKKGKLVGIDFDELGVNEVVDTLRTANMEAVLRDFDNRNPQEDPVIHFYEVFLKEYDAKKRMQRGVFYTPKPIVSYIVRSVHELFQNEFGLEDGLADTATWGQMLEKHSDLKLPEIEVVDPKTNKRESNPIDPETPFVQVLDPATGTATFLVEVIDVIYKTMRAKWEADGHGDLWINQKWNEYVPQHLLPRLHGYELMMAPYAIAHMKIGLKLFETGYTFGSDERARIYLTNALEPPQDFSDTFEQMAPALAHEAQAVNNVKRHQRFTVVVGNPPYAGASENMSSDAQQLVDRYRHIDGQPLDEVKLWLQNDYVKFIAFSHGILERTGTGVFGFITDNSYLDGPTFRGLRFGLAQTFGTVRILNLRGSSKRRDRTDHGDADENVFDITQGVTIILTASEPSRQRLAPSYASLAGTRELKYSILLQRHIEFSEIGWSPPFYLFTPSDHSLRDEWEAFVRITDAFVAKGNGFMTGRDGFVIAYTKSEIASRIRDFFDLDVSDNQLRERYGISDYRAFKIHEVRRNLQFQSNRLVQASYRPFDHRWTYFQRPIIQEWQSSVHEHMFRKENLALCVGRAGNVVGGAWDICFCTKMVTDLNQFYRGGNVSLPIYHYPAADAMRQTRWPNLSEDFVEQLAIAFGVSIESEGMPDGVTPENVLHYAYAIFYSPTYRQRYEGFLRLDFPHLPLTDKIEFFLRIAAVGSKLVALHLLESPQLDNPITKFKGPANPEVEKVSYTDASGCSVWLDKAQTCGFVGVPEAVWNFHIGGYQVCEKWLKDRRAKGGKNPRPGRKLTAEDITHYGKIVTAIHHTIHLMKEIDKVIDAHGGWPDAFITDPEELEKLKSPKA